MLDDLGQEQVWAFQDGQRNANYLCEGQLPSPGISVRISVSVLLFVSANIFVSLHVAYAPTAGRFENTQQY